MISNEIIDNLEKDTLALREFFDLPGTVSAKKVDEKTWVWHPLDLDNKSGTAESDLKLFQLEEEARNNVLSARSRIDQALTFVFENRGLLFG